MTKVSIITSVYMPSMYKFARLAGSIDAQTNQDFEWIVVNDQSVSRIVDTFGVPFKEVTLGDNYGPGTARNVGFMLSDGDYITYVDADDELSNDRVEHIIYMFEKYPNTKLLFDGYRLIDEENKAEVVFNPISLKTNWSVDYVEYLKRQNMSIPMGVSHTRKLFVDAGMFQRGIVCGEDGILWRRMSEKIKPESIMLTDHIAGIYHIHNNGQSRTQRRFDMGGFAFDAKDLEGSNGQSLDKNWFETYNSKDLFDR